MNNSLNGIELRSAITRQGRLEIALADIALEEPGPGEVVARVEATPINPSDLGLMFGPADPDQLEAGGTAERPTLSAPIPEQAMPAVTGRLDRPMPVGNEGAGTVVRAGSGAEHLLGRTVGMLGGGMYATLRRLPAADCIVLPESATVVDGASMFINPLTALGFVETMRMEGHRAIVHGPAASNLGQMLNRICLKDGVPLVNIVRGDEQRRLLREAGASFVLDSAAPSFEAELAEAVAETEATLAFDAIGGGVQAARILDAMERMAVGKMKAYSPYGSDIPKQVYVYGALDRSPIILDRTVGLAWSVGGWLLWPFLAKLGAEGTARLKQRVADELTTTFASRYAATISLADALNPDTARAYQRKSTGRKYLIDPSR